MTDSTAVVRGLAERARVASRHLALLTRAEKDAALLALADAVDAATEQVVAANAEEDWQAELWGWDWMAEDDRALRAEAFRLAMEFVRAATVGA